MLSRPLARLRHLGAYIVFLLATLSLTAIAYTLGSWLAWQTEHPSPGTLSAESLSLVAVYTSLLFLAIGGIGLACSACVRERGKALGLALGLTIGMYAWNFLASLSTTLAPSTVVSLWHWFNPAPVAGGAGLPVADIAVLGGVAAVSTAAAVLQFLRRDL